MKFLHTMIRVNNLDESLKFYCDHLGMKLLRKQDYPGGEFTLAFIGYGDEKNNTVIELTHNWGTSSYDQGSAFGHLALLEQAKSGWLPAKQNIVSDGKRWDEIYLLVNGADSGSFSIARRARTD